MKWKSQYTAIPLYTNTHLTQITKININNLKRIRQRDQDEPEESIRNNTNVHEHAFYKKATITNKNNLRMGRQMDEYEDNQKQ